MAQRSIATYFKRPPAQPTVNSEKDSELDSQSFQHSEQLTEAEQHLGPSDQQDQDCQFPACLDTLVPYHPY